MTVQDCVDMTAQYKTHNSMYPSSREETCLSQAESVPGLHTAPNYDDLSHGAPDQLEQ